ncbi:MAG: hypothetical protein GY868_14230, partial [Deltaproteobacteria bacterium]|nr:hypothetical protein [Deltaproteobacteria bacterium]
MNQRLYAAAVPVSGLLTAQAVAAVHIYFSNIMLWRSIDAVMRAGYLAVPNAHVAASLRSVLPAMAGGVFFSLSVGAALSLVTW